MPKKLCDDYPEARLLCDHLKHEESLYVNRILADMMTGYDVSRLEEHTHCMEANCGLRVFHRLLGFFKLYKDIPEFRDLLNQPEFPVSVLKQLFIYILYQEKNNGHETAWITDNFFDFLNPEKMIQIISETDILKLEPEFVLHTLSRFGNRYMDKLLAQSEGIRKQLTTLFLESSEEHVSSILSVNPVIYDYIMLFLELEGRNEEAQEFDAHYTEVYQGAKKIQNITDEIKSDIRNYTLPLTGEDREKRILSIINKLGTVPDRIQGYKILISNSAFADDREREMVKLILTDPDLAQFLNLSGKITKNVQESPESH